MKSKSLASALGYAGVFAAQAVSANVILDFENPLPDGLAPTSYWQGALVPNSAKLTNQYLSLGIAMSDAALVAGGYGHSASGTNSLAGIDADGRINYDIPVTFSFFQPGNSSVEGTTDYFAYRTDLGGGSGNVITISAYDLTGALMGQASYLESATSMTPLSISGIGQFHRVTVDQTLQSTYSGGIMLDLVEFGDIEVGRVPEPQALALIALGLAGIGLSRRGSNR